jgi:hypothetical protein
VNAHPTRPELEQYRDRQLSATALLHVDDHLKSCEDCRTLISPGAEPISLGPDSSEHLDYDEMERFVDGHASPAEREIVESHIEVCTRCRDQMEDLSALAAPSRSRRWRFALPLAAAVAVAVAAGWIVSRRQLTSPPNPPISRSVSPQLAPVERPAIIAALAGDSSSLRSSTNSAKPFALRSPVTTVVLDARPLFRWEALKGARSYSIAVVDVDSQEVAAEGTSSTESWRPPKDLRRGRAYSWQVTARRDGESVLSPRPPAPEVRFQVATDEESRAVEKLKSLLGNDPAAVGSMLAKRGFLDDAERELSASNDPRSRVLLERIRTWR